jgi:MFS family permease
MKGIWYTNCGMLEFLRNMVFIDRGGLMRSYFILAMCFLFLFQYFGHFHWLQFILAVFAAIAFLGSISLARTAPRIFSILMFTAAVALTFIKGQGIDALVTGITSNLPLLTLLVLVPLLSIPLKMGGFFDSILLHLKQYQNHPRKMFTRITTVLFFLGPILNIGAIRIIDDLVKDLRLNSTFLSKAYLVGFSTTILWSPYYAAVGITLLYLHVSITDYMSYGFGIAVLFLLIGNVMFGFWAKKQKLEIKDQPNEMITPDHRKRIKVLAVIIFSLMLLTITAESITHWSMLVLVSLLAILFPVVWGLFSRQWRSLQHHLVDYRDKTVPIMNNEIIMYISAGLFGQSLKGTSFGHGINVFMTNLSHVSFLLLALFILITMVCVTFVGIHQVVVVTVLATQMDPATLGTSKEILAMVIMLAWSASSILSPVNPINLLVSTLVKKSSIEVGVRDNGLYLLTVCTMGILILTLFH